MSDHMDSVNEIIAYHANIKLHFKSREDHQKAAQHSRWESVLRAYVRDYQELEKLTRPIPTDGDDDLSDLPPELLKELSVTKTDDLENQIATIVNAAGGQADIDKILIHLFRRFKVTQTRKFLQNKLWRMTNKGILFSVPGRKGWYSTQSVTDNDEDDLVESIMNTPMVYADGKTVFDDEMDDDIPF